MTTEEEHRILKVFKELYPEFPFGNIEKYESPDFILKTKNQTIGIELTEAFQEENLQKTSSTKAKFLDILINQIQSKISFTFFINIRFNSSYTLKQDNKRRLQNILVPICVQALLTLKNKEIIKLADHNNLPDEIDIVTLGRYDGLKCSYNQQSEGGSVSNFTDIHLAKILEKKHQQLSKYKQCDEQWLIIKEGNYYAGTFDDIVIQNRIVSPFDKIFILRSSMRAITQLK